MVAGFRRFVFLRRALPLAAVFAVPALAAPLPPVVIDWAKGDMQETPASCGAFAFKHLANHHSYSLLVRGTAPGTCSFEAEGLKFRLPSNYGATSPGAMTLFNFERYGSDVIVTWLPGY